MGKAGGGIRLGQGLQNWKLVLAGKQFNSGHPDSTCVPIWLFGVKRCKTWYGFGLRRLSLWRQKSYFNASDGRWFSSLPLSTSFWFYRIRKALWHLWEEWQPFEKLPAVGSGFEHLPVPSGLEEPDRHKVAACSCNWREPVFSGGTRWWRCRSRWSRRLPPRPGRAGTWRYFRTFSSSTSLPDDSSISQSEIGIRV